MAFKKAEKTQQKLRLGLIGPSGSGKTYTALSVAKHMGARIAVIDTEHGSASKYAGDVAEFDACELDTFSPSAYITALKDAADYDVVIIDSLSHAWVGKGGILDQADARGGKFNVWKDLTPQHNALIEAIVSHPAHLIATMRAKTEYEVGRDSNGKATVERVGTAAVQRDGLEYEMDVVGHLDQSNTLTVIKTRCAALNNKAIRLPGKDLADALMRWLGEGAPAAPKSAPRAVAQTFEERVASARKACAAVKSLAELAEFEKKMNASSDDVKLAVSPDFLLKKQELQNDNSVAAQ